jgi:hypothetical protein
MYANPTTQLFVRLCMQGQYVVEIFVKSRSYLYFGVSGEYLFFFLVVRPDRSRFVPSVSMPDSLCPAPSPHIRELTPVLVLLL